MDPESLIARITEHDSRLRQLVSTKSPVTFPDDLTLRQLQLLLVIRATPRTTGQALAEAQQVSTPTISGLVDRLVGKGLLVREPDTADRRRVLLSLSDAGHAVLDDLEGMGNRHRDRVLSRLSVEELADLERIYGRLVDVATQVAGESAAGESAAGGPEPGDERSGARGDR